MRFRYTVVLEGREWEVEIEEDIARIDQREIRLLHSAVPGILVVEADGRRLRLSPRPGNPQGSLGLLVDGKILEGRVQGEQDRLRMKCRSQSTARGPTQLRSEIPGIIRKVLHRRGDPVEEGEPILTLEAMKMENEVRTTEKGQVSAIHVKPGQKVNVGDILAVIEPA